MSTIEPKPLIAVRRREELDQEALQRVLEVARRLSASSDLTEILAVILDALHFEPKARPTPQRRASDA